MNELKKELQLGRLSWEIPLYNLLDILTIRSRHQVEMSFEFAAVKFIAFVVLVHHFPHFFHKGGKNTCQLYDYLWNGHHSAPNPCLLAWRLLVPGSFRS